MLHVFPGMAVAADSKYTYQNSTNLSTWLWDTSRIVSEPDTVINNLVLHHVNDLFLQIDTTIEQQVYREFISKATVNGIRIHALDGAPEWLTDQKMQNAFLKWLNSYQKAALADEKFKGIHLDVEPYEHEQYEVKPHDLLVRYQSMMITMRNQANTLNLEFGIDIPFWFYGVMYNNKYGKGNMAEWLCKHVEFITIMAYRDTGAGTDGIIGISAAEMKLFHKYNVKGTIAVETGRLAEDYKFVTFYEEGKDYLYEQLNLVYKHYNAEPALYGIAIHHYDSWMAMS
ncbi:hypothetical protein AC625_10820 [Peribacillus loiseleuriae]|uniref:Amidase n=2 Tax=Peribacillus loiseleuriae TaxID=1679170 RepID=A0A0K9H010_9BACI|nr:hypothetical protein AC625_10820 [Peribacillus loiseleuriae]